MNAQKNQESDTGMLHPMLKPPNKKSGPTLMSAEFDKAFDFVIVAEGGYTNDPNDHGGETRFGISKRAFPFIDIKDLTLEQAGKIYRDHYWDVLPMADLPNPLAFCLFDTAVNCGVGRAIKLLQMACGVSADGVVGPITIKAAQEPNVVAKFMDLRREYYESLSTFRTFGKGWLKRCDNVEAACYANS